MLSLHPPGHQIRRKRKNPTQTALAKETYVAPRYSSNNNNATDFHMNVRGACPNMGMTANNNADHRQDHLMAQTHFAQVSTSITANIHFSQVFSFFVVVPRID